MTLHTLWMLVIVPALAAGVGAAVLPGPGGKIELSLVCFNIRYDTPHDGENRWELRRGQVGRLIRDHSADIVGVQEALHHQLTEMLTDMPEYAHVGVGRDDGAERGEYSPILYRADRFEVADSGTFWFSEEPGRPGSTDWGNRITRICTWARLIDAPTGRPFYIFNVHLDHESQRSRERSVRLLAERIAARTEGIPVILMGDLNAAESNPATLWITGELTPEPGGEPRGPLMIDTFRALHPEADAVGTFHAFTGLDTGEKIDFIFVQPGVLVLDAQIDKRHRDGRYPSDHFPVTARIVLP